MLAEQLTDPIADHGEGPVWFEHRNELRWVDMLRGIVWVLGATNASPVRQQLPVEVVAAIRPRAAGGAVVAVGKGFAIQPNLDSPSIEIISVVDVGRASRMNEGGCDPDGRFYCGTMDETGEATAALFRLDGDHSVTTVLSGVGISNGLGWSPDNSTAYYVDSVRGQIDMFDYEFHSGLTNRRIFTHIDPDLGAPDGLTVDREGYVWVAMWDGAAVRRYSPRGILDEAVAVPVSRVTACAFGGDDLDTLYITTSAVGVGRSTERRAGALFGVLTGGLGMQPTPYAG